MKDVLKKKLSSELYSQVIEALGDDFDYVPRSRLNEVIVKRDEYKDQLASLKTKADQYDDILVLKTNLEKTLGDTKAQHQADLDKFAKDMSNIKTESTVKEKLLINKVKNPVAAMALLKADAFGEDLAGIDAEIARIKESDPYLFGDTVPGGTGMQGGTPGGVSTSTLEQLSTQHADALKSGNIALAVSLKNKMFELSTKK